MIKIDSDKVLNINGQRTFPVGIYFVCNKEWENSGQVGPCTPSDNSGFTFSQEDHNLAEINASRTLYEDAGVRFVLYAPEVVNNIPISHKNSPYFLGYYQKDEPSDSERQTMINTYNSLKSQDPDHIVMLTLHNKPTLSQWAPAADVLCSDFYTITDTGDYPRDTAATYAFEWIAKDSGFNGSDPTDINKPIWLILQANGNQFPYSGVGTMLTPTPTEVRCMTYTTITMDLKGIVYWGYEITTASGEDPNNLHGLYANPSLHSYYKQIAGEIRSFNDWLVSPTIDYKWGYHAGNNNVTFDKTLTKTVIGTQFTNFNYILKNYNGATYLIVLNKDSRSIADVGITISGLTGSTVATTLGIATQGSGRAGRNINVNNGKLVDSFDGSVVHIYQIGGTTPVTKYRCSGSPDFQCIEDPNGPYDNLAACQAYCSGNQNNYGCNGSQCQQGYGSLPAGCNGQCNTAPISGCNTDQFNILGGCVDKKVAYIGLGTIGLLTLLYIAKRK